MDFNLTPVQQQLQARAQQMVYRLEPDASAEAVVDAAAQAQLLDREEDLLAAAVAVEAIAWTSVSAGIIVALHSSVLRAIGEHPLLRELERGERVGAIALSSDDYPTAGATLSGRASWVAPLTTNGLAVVGARADDGFGAYVVALDAPGVTIDPIQTSALEGMVCGHLILESAAATPLGPTQAIMTRARILLAAAGLGMGRRALHEALQVARALNRTGAGGEQTVQGLLADAATELDAAMLLMWKAASAYTPSLAEASLAKLAATEATQRAVARATQIVGAASFTSGHIIDRLARDVRALELFAGRTEALREAAAAELL
jgi:acyl-CoA dehydrogenase